MATLAAELAMLAKVDTKKAGTSTRFTFILFHSLSLKVRS